MKLLPLLSIALTAFVSAVLLVTGEEVQNPTSRLQCSAPSHPDYLPLMALYNASNGDEWVNNAQWGMDCDVCTWYGVLCDNQRVIRVQLGNNNLTGFLPSELELLDSLKILNFFNNNLFGSIPEGILNLPKLEDLNFSLNDLSGQFPEIPPHIEHLEILRMSNNSLEGELPSSLGSLSKIREINFSNNELNGGLPLPLFNAQSLEKLRLANNEFVGPYPSELGNLINLTDLDLSNNNFTGSLPNSISALSQLKYLNLSYNPTELVFPSFIAEYKDLESLWMINAGVQGAIPEEFGNLTKLKTVRLERNNISEFSLQDFSNLPNLRTLYLNDNNISSEIPINIGQASSLFDLRLNNNNFYGSLPSSLQYLGKLRYLYLSDNALSGQIPIDLANMKGIYDFRISNNSISGEISGKFEGLNELRTLDLSKNDLTGSFPEYLGELPNLGTLNLSFNRLEDCLPETYKNFCGLDLSRINLNQNCTFENPSFMEFCLGNACNNSLNISVDKQHYCEGEILELRAPSGYEYYEWSSSPDKSNVAYSTALISQYHYLTITTNKGCSKVDSIFVTVAPEVFGEESAAFCSGESITINGETFTEEGNYTQILSRPGKCDSTVFVDIMVNESSSALLSTSICPGTTVSINGEVFGPGSFTQVIDNSSGCDSIISINILEQDSFEEFISVNVCEDETYDFGGQELLSGSYMFEYTSIDGCDSIVTVEVNTSSNTFGYYEEGICPGNTTLVNGVEYEIGEHTQIISNVAGCDSLISILISPLPSYAESIDVELCTGDIYTYEGQELTFGSYSFTYLTNYGCDSVVNITVLPLEKDEVFVSEVICQGQEFEFAGQSYGEAGSYKFVFENASGCDSIVNLLLMFTEGEDLWIEYEICEGESYPFAGKNYYESTVVSDSLLIDGCKTWVTLNLMVNETKISESSKELCFGETEFFYGSELFQSGTYHHTLQSKDGCDSTVILHLTISELHQSYLDTFICQGSDLQFLGKSFDEVGEYQIERPIDGSCPELVNLSISLYESEKLIVQEIVCYGEEVEFDGLFYGGGQYTGTYHDGNCLREFELTVAELAYNYVDEVITTCSDQPIEFMGKKYSSGGIYYVGQNLEACQFLENLYVLEASNDVKISQLIFCEGRQVNIDGLEIDTTGIYPVEAATSCTEQYYDVLFINGDDIVLDKFISVGQRLVIQNEVFDSSGNYELQIGEDLACPTRLFLNLYVESCGGIRQDSLMICEGETIDYYGSLISEAGTYTISKELEIGCDSSIVLVVEAGIIEEFEIEGPRYICEGESINLFGPEGFTYLWNDSSKQRALKVDHPGTYSLNIYETNGCSKQSSVTVQGIYFPQNAIDVVTVDPSDCGIADGSIRVESNDGQDYLYSIDGGEKFQKSALFTYLQSGSYRIVLADTNLLCTKAFPTTISLEGPGLPLIDSIKLFDENPCKSRGGIIQIYPSDATKIYEYSIDGGISWSTEQRFTNLNHGIYNIQLRRPDSECVNNLWEPVELLLVDSIQASIFIESEPSCKNAFDGAATLKIDKGLPPFEILWSTGSRDTSVSNLASGEYSVSIVDANGCQEDLELDLKGIDLSELLLPFVDVIKCEDEVFYFEADSSFEYQIYREGEAFYYGNRPSVLEAGTYEVGLNTTADCLESKLFTVENQSAEDLGIDFLMSTESVRGVEVIVVNISDSNDVDFTWHVNTDIELSPINEFSQSFIFPDTGTYKISLSGKFDECEVSIEKSIIIYPDSSYLSVHKDPERQVALDGFGSFTVYPSPNNGDFQVEIEMLSAKVPVSISIFDIYGTLIRERYVQGFTNYSEAFSLINSGNGVYSVVLQVRNKVFSKNILIVR